MHILRRSNQKLKKTTHYFPHMITFCNFALKIETSWVKQVVKPILETWNANDVIVYVWLIYSQITKTKKYTT